MERVLRTEVVAYSPAEMFALVADVERYPEFLPWCRSVAVVSRGPAETTARFGMGHGLVRASFTAVARYEPPLRIRLELVEGFFSRFLGCWTFETLPEGGTLIQLDLAFEIAAGPLARLLRPIFGRAADTMVDAFRRRARSLYGPRAEPRDHRPTVVEEVHHG